jgi:hypothetical protein
MSSLSATTRYATRWTAVAVLCAASATGCSRSITLPPLVEEQGSPQIPGKLGGILDTSKDGRVPKGGHRLSAMSVASIDATLAAVDKAGGKQLEAPIDRYGGGFYGHR